jgi:hypothetical protein
MHMICKDISPLINIKAQGVGTRIGMKIVNKIQGAVKELIYIKRISYARSDNC